MTQTPPFTDFQLPTDRAAEGTKQGCPEVPNTRAKLSSGDGDADEYPAANHDWTERKRLAALHGCLILDTPPEKGFDDAAELASLLCSAHIAQVSFIDADRQWIKASVGIPGKESPRAFSFCAHTINVARPLIVEDTFLDQRFQHNPLVLGAPFIRSYAGAPLIDREGHVLGTVCVIDTVARSFTEQHIAGLQALSRQVVTLLEHRKTLLDQQVLAVDAQLRNRESLTAAADRLRLSQQVGRIASWEWDGEVGAFHWTGESSSTFGKPTSDLQSLEEVLSYLHPGDAQEVIKAVNQALVAKKDFRTEFRVLLPDGTVQWAMAVGKPLFNADGKALRIVGICMDITARKQAEEALLQNEKLAIVGRLASSIAHEINNPLESVTNLLYLARTSDDPALVGEYLASADVELSRVSEIANQTLRFHKQATKPQEVSGHEIVSGVLAVQQSRIRNAHVEVCRRDRVTRPVLCFEGEIRQVISNLVGNAVDALSTGGKLHLRTREGQDLLTGRHGLVFTIADTGTGISPANRAKIFDAFFSTKGSKGTGLGLWVCREIIDRHHGRLNLRSSQSSRSKGTVFTVFLPFDAVKREGLEA